MYFLLIRQFKFHLSLVYFCGTAIKWSCPFQTEFRRDQTIVPNLLWIFMVADGELGIPIMREE
jgi:hypothetical protein